MEKLATFATLTWAAHDVFVKSFHVFPTFNLVVESEFFIHGTYIFQKDEL